MASEQRLAVILFSDIHGYSKMMDEDESITLRLLESHTQRLTSIIREYGGEVIKLVGDAILSTFVSSTAAIKCAMAQQRSLLDEPIQDSGIGPVRVRIGIHLGEVTFRDADVFGNGVNIASRLQSQGHPGEIVLSQVVVDQVRHEFGDWIEALGNLNLKNIREPITAYAIRFEQPDPANPEAKSAPLKPAQSVSRRQVPIETLPDSTSIYPSTPAPANLPSDWRLQPMTRQRQFATTQLERNFAQGNLDFTEFETRLERVLDAKDNSVIEAALQGLEIQSQQHNQLPPVVNPKDTDTIVAVLGGVERKAGWIPARKTQMIAALGGIKLDYRNARLASGVTAIHVIIALGGIEIIVPPDINVDIQVVGVLGGVSGESRAVDPEAPTLRIEGYAVLGGLEIKAKKADPRIRQALQGWAKSIDGRSEDEV